jgi:hypothetical protein
VHYDTLDADLVELDRKSKEFAAIETYSPNPPFRPPVPPRCLLSSHLAMPLREAAEL